MSDLDFELKCKCQICDYDENIMVHKQDYADWQNGELIQEAFPYLSDSQREIMMSSVCGECFDKMFPPEDDD